MPFLFNHTERHSPAKMVPRMSSINIPAGKAVLTGDLVLPKYPKGIILFAHGSGSSRLSPRNRYVAEVLHEQGLGTLLTDLLTPLEEEIDRETRHLRFNISLLADRLKRITDWSQTNPDIQGLDIGYFGASTGAAAALIAAATHADLVRAVVSRGGRPDLAADFLPQVKAPVLLIVGEHDPEVISLNKKALARLNNSSRLDIIPRATHLFEEPGALEDVAHLAANWFGEHMGPLPGAG